MSNTHLHIKQRGFVLITTYLIVFLISVFSLAYFTRYSTFLHASERSQNKIVAFNMAEAGVDFALAQLAADPAYAGTNGYMSMDTGTIRGGFSITVTTPQNSSTVRMVQASGFSPDNDTTSRAYQSSSITTYGQLQPSSPFSFGVFAANTISLTGNVRVNSYHSRDGTYGGSNATNKGNVATNSTANGAINLTGSSELRGGATVGFGGNVNTGITKGWSCVISGAKAVAPAVKTYDPPTTTTPVSGPLSVGGNSTLYLMSGTYHYSSLTVGGSGKLQPTGPVKIYVDGAVDIGGAGIATQNNIPANLQIYVTGNSSVKVHGSGALYGTIYAPLSRVYNTGNVRIAGAIISNTFELTGSSEFHYDEALSEAGADSGPSGKVNVTAWQEQNSLTWGTGA
jgi:Tfp pilus assembly protein PilX